MDAYPRHKAIAGELPWWGVMDYRDGYVTRPTSHSVPLSCSRSRGKSRRIASNDPDFPPGPDLVKSSFAWFLATAGHNEAAKGYEAAYASAYDRIVSNIKGSQTAQAGLLVAESRASIAMIAKRTVSILSFVNELHKGNLTSAARALNVYKSNQFTKRRSKLSRQLRDAAGDISNVALELKFGWVPMIQDIGKAVETLQKSYPPSRVKGSGSSSNGVHDAVYQPGATYISDGFYRIGVRCHAQISAVNPNLYLANSLGFVNPVNIAWQVIPLSFLIDWFLPIGKFLNSFTDLVGVSLENCCVSYQGEGSGLSGVVYGPGLFRQVDSSAFHFTRNVVSDFNVPAFRSRLNLPTGDIGKAITAIELLVQRLTRPGR